MTARDVPQALRDQISTWLAGLKNADHLRTLLLDPASSSSAEEQAWVFGEALPAGLVLQ